VRLHWPATGTKPLLEVGTLRKLLDVNSQAMKQLVAEFIFSVVCLPRIALLKNPSGGSFFVAVVGINVKHFLARIVYSLITVVYS
jgi:hypothetical protein